jgi:hypothetical protein
MDRAGRLDRLIPQQNAGSISSAAETHLTLEEMQGVTDAESFVVPAHGVSTASVMEEVSSEVNAAGEDAVTSSHEARA